MRKTQDSALRPTPACGSCAAPGCICSHGRPGAANSCGSPAASSFLHAASSNQQAQHQPQIQPHRSLHLQSCPARPRPAQPCPPATASSSSGASAWPRRPGRRARRRPQAWEPLLAALQGSAWLRRPQARAGGEGGGGAAPWASFLPPPVQGLPPLEPPPLAQPLAPAHPAAPPSLASPPPAGPYGTYAKGGSETGMLGGMGSAAAPPAPGAKPDVSARIAQVSCQLWVWACPHASASQGTLGAGALPLPIPAVRAVRAAPRRPSNTLPSHASSRRGTALACASPSCPAPPAPPPLFTGDHGPRGRLRVLPARHPAPPGALCHWAVLLRNSGPLRLAVNCKATCATLVKRCLALPREFMPDGLPVLPPGLELGVSSAIVLTNLREGHGGVAQLAAQAAGGSKCPVGSASRLLLFCLFCVAGMAGSSLWQGPVGSHRWSGLAARCMSGEGCPEGRCARPSCKAGLGQRREHASPPAWR